MTRLSKREAERRIDELGRDVSEQVLEIIKGPGMVIGEAPRLTTYLVEHGFFVEREPRTHDNGFRDVLLSPMPAYCDVANLVSWYWDGPTADMDDVYVKWDDDRFAAMIDEAAAPYDVPPYPGREVDDPVTVAEGDGWRAVAPRAAVIENPIMHRGEAERDGREILGAVELDDSSADGHDLVEVAES